MRKLTLLIFATVLAFSFVGCNDASKQSNNSNSPSTPPDVNKGAKPVADAEIAVVEMENSAAFGSFKIELYSNVAPKMVARFKELAKEGFYNGIAFHRINRSVIQAGDGRTKPGAPASPKEIGSGKDTVPAEFSDIPYDTAIVGAARGPDFNSADSQFFVTLKREPGFDNKYTIFGKVIDGMNNVRTIAGAPKNGEKPQVDIRIKEIKIVAKE